MHSKQIGNGEKWSVAFACCFINSILDGIGRLVGIFFAATLEEFPGTGRQSAALPYILCSAIRNISGPLVGLLGKQYGVHKVTMCGALLSALGIGLCFFAPSILWVTILWGGIFGIGFGLGNILLPVAISVSFQKNQGTATGISFAGSCLGSFFLPSLFYYLLDGFGLHGLFLITSAVVLNCIPASLLLRPLRILQEPQLPTSDERGKLENETEFPVTELDPADSDSSSGMYEDADTCFKSFVEASQKTVTSLKSLTSNGSTIRDEDSVKSKELTVNAPKKPLVLRVSVIECTFTCDSRFPSLPTDLDYLTAQRNTNRSRSVPIGCYDNSMFVGDSCELCTSKDLQRNGQTNIFSEDESTHVGRFDDLEKGTCIRLSRKTTSMRHSEKLKIDGAVSETNISQTSLKNTISQCLRIFTNQCFFIVTLAMATHEFVFIAVITVIVDFSNDLQVSQDKAKWLFMVFSAGDLFGRLCLGCITDKKIITRNCFAAFCFLGMMGALLGMSISDGFYSLLGCSGVFGIFEAGAFIMFPLLMVQCVQPEYHTVAIASSNLFPGITALAVPPTVGYFRDEIGSYLGLFYILGAVSVISSILCLSLPHVAGRRHSQR